LLRGDSLRTVKTGKLQLQEFNKVIYFIKTNPNKYELGKGPKHFIVQSLFQKGIGWTAIIQGNVDQTFIAQLAGKNAFQEVFDKSGAHLCWNIKIPDKVSFFNTLSASRLLHKSVYGHGQIFFIPAEGVKVPETQYVLTDITQGESKAVVMRGTLNPKDFGPVSPQPKLLECQTSQNLIVWNLLPLMTKYKVKYIKEVQHRYYSIRMLNQLHSLGWNYESLHELNAFLFQKTNDPNPIPNRINNADFVFVTSAYFQGFKIEVQGEVPLEVMKKLEAQGFQRLERLTGPEGFIYSWYLKIAGHLGIEKKLTAKAVKRKQKKLQNQTLLVCDGLREFNWDVISNWGGTGKVNTLLLQRVNVAVPGHYILIDVGYYGKHPAIEIQGHSSLVTESAVRWLVKDTGLYPPSKVPDPKDNSLLCWATVVPLNFSALSAKVQRKQQNKFRRVFLRLLHRAARIGWEYKFPYGTASILFVRNDMKDYHLKFEKEEEEKLKKQKEDEEAQKKEGATATAVVGDGTTPIGPEGASTVEDGSSVEDFLKAQFKEPENTDVNPLQLLQAAEDLSIGIKNFNSALTLEDDMEFQNPNEGGFVEVEGKDDDDELNLDWCSDL